MSVPKSKNLLATIMKLRVSRQGYKHLTKFSGSVQFKAAASTMQKIKSVDCFNLCP